MQEDSPWSSPCLHHPLHLPLLSRCIPSSSHAEWLSTLPVFRTLAHSSMRFTFTLSAWNSLSPVSCITSQTLSPNGSLTFSCCPQTQAEDPLGASLCDSNYQLLLVCLHYLLQLLLGRKCISFISVRIRTMYGTREFIFLKKGKWMTWWINKLREKKNRFWKPETGVTERKTRGQGSGRAAVETARGAHGRSYSCLWQQMGHKIFRSQGHHLFWEISNQLKRALMMSSAYPISLQGPRESELLAIKINPSQQRPILGPFF